MSAADVVCNIFDNGLYKSNLKYCLVDYHKLPFRYDGIIARPNNISDFVDFDTLLQCKKIDSYAGVGISIQASNICAIDVDHCFEVKNNIDSADERAKDILNRFKDIAYCEFSFSGTGLRILFRMNEIEEYNSKYYTKNSSKGVEFYQPGKSYRYVTITGNVIYDNKVQQLGDISNVIQFLNDYMKRPEKVKRVVISHEDRSKEELMIEVKKLYFKDSFFQDMWFDKAPGSGKDESERDYRLLATLYEKITQDKAMLQEIFEMSPYFNSKDPKHLHKWKYNNYRYFEYMYNNLEAK